MANTAARRALGKRPANFSAVMAGLMQPNLDADLHDPELVRLEARAKKAAQKQAEREWHVAWLRCQAARHEHQAEDTRRVIASRLLGEGTSFDDTRLRTLHAAWVHAIDVVMRRPAPHVRGLRWKQDHAKVVREWTPAGRAAGPNPKWAGYIVEDEARLGKTVRGNA